VTEIIHKKESYAMIGACFEVYNEKGCGFLEPVYQGCLGIELEYQLIPVIPKPSSPKLEYDRIAKTPAHKNKNRLVRCLSLIHSRLFA
jgi:hypothetical protein